MPLNLLAVKALAVCMRRGLWAAVVNAAREGSVVRSPLSLSGCCYVCMLYASDSMFFSLR